MGDDRPDGDSGLLAVGDEVAPGSRVAGYLVEERIGRGGMGVVFRAQDQRLGRQVALKILAPARTADQAFRQRFIGPVSRFPFELVNCAPSPPG